MMEKIKSVILALLVLLSLFQSFLLTYNSPKFEPINQSDYVQAELSGTQIELDKLIFPDQIVLHSGQPGHTVLYPNTTDYSFILENIKQTTFDGFRRLNLQLAGINWEDVRNKQPGLEIRFKEALPFSVLQTLLQVKGDTSLDNEMISRIWISLKDNHEEVKTYFMTSSSGEVYEALKTNISVKDVEKLVQRGESAPSYHTVNGDYYIPDQPLEVSSFRFPYTQYSAEELKKSLFVDPAITRNLTERDGSEIYTDGKRGLQIKTEQHWMSYSDPVAPADSSRSDLKENLLSAVQFINQHGGWNGTYAIDQLPQKTGASEGDQTFIFRQYYGSYPIMDPPYTYYGYMKVLLQRGIVSNYERSIIVPDTKNVFEQKGTLPGGKELESLLEAAAKKGTIVSVYPAYRAEITEQYVNLTPAWAVEYRDGNVEFVG